MRGSHLALLATLPLAACSIYDTSLLKQTATGAGGNGNGGSGGDTAGGGGQSAGANGGAGGGVCGSARWPDRPGPESVITPGGNVEIVGIMSAIQLGDAEPNVTTPPTEFLKLGFDMDKKCTTAQNLKTAAECHIPSYGFGTLDGPNGIDNAVGQVVQLTRNILGSALFSSTIYSQQLLDGVTNVIVRVQDFNGEDNDDQVTVTTLVSAKFDALTPGAKPKWDGHDVWPISSDSFKADGKTPLFQDKNAYVVNKQVVVNLQAADLKLVVGLSNLVKINLDLVLHGAEIVCDLENTSVGAWGFRARNCILGARWLADDLIHQLSHFGDPGQAAGTPLCTDSNLYKQFKTNICGLIDISDNGLESTGTDCNSLSMGLKFDMDPGLLGDVFPVNPIGEKCIKPGTKPSEDSCENQPEGGLGGAGGAGGASSGGAGGKGGAGGATGGAGSGSGGAKDASTD